MAETCRSTRSTVVVHRPWFYAVHHHLVPIYSGPEVRQNVDDERDEKTFIYVVYNEERNRSKIGKANNPKKRLANLQTGSVDDLELTHEQPVEKNAATSVERLAHKLAVEAGKRKKREWFSRTTPEEARGFVETAYHTIRGRNR